MTYDRKELETHSFDYLMDLLREEYPFKSRSWYEYYETKDEVIDKLMETSE